MTDEVKMVFQGNALLPAMAAALMIGVIFCRNRRKRFFVPCIIISCIILNPVIYSVWSGFSNYGYWRLLWILPVIPAFAMVPAYVIEKARTNGLKLVLTGITVVGIAYCGFFVYSKSNTSFVRASNPDKLPQDVVYTAEALLELEDEPRVVTDASISQYLRQYSGKIHSMYSRDVVFEGPNSHQARVVYAQLSSSEGDMSIVAQEMKEYNYRYLVTNNMNADRKQEIQEAGFELIRQINEYGLYRIDD